MKIICFPHFYYLSEASRLVEIGKVLRNLGHEVQFFSHGGMYEWVARGEGFEVVPVEPQMTAERAEEFKAFNRGERDPRGSFFTFEELKEYVPPEADAFREARADAVLIGWNLPSYLSVQLVDIPIIVQQPGPFTAPFFDRGMTAFAPSLKFPGVNLLRYLPMNRILTWLVPRLQIWIGPFNQLAADLGLPQYKSLLDMMAGDLTLVMDAPEILGIPPEDLVHYQPRHPEFFRRPPTYRYGGPCFARIPGDVPKRVRQHFETSKTKVYCSMGTSTTPEVLSAIIDIVGDLDLRAVIGATTILDESSRDRSDRVLVVPHFPAHLVNPLADIAITHGGAGTVQTAIHAGTPLVGVPMHLEQAGNISLVQRQGAGVMLWKQSLSRRRLSRALEKLVTESSFKENMLRLKQIQDRIDGATNAAQAILSFLGNRR